MKLYFINIEDTLENMELETLVDYCREMHNGEQNTTETAFLLARLLYTKRLQRITDNDKEFQQLIDCINDINILFSTHYQNDELKITVTDFHEEDFVIYDGVIDDEITQEEIEAIEQSIKNNF